MYYFVVIFVFILYKHNIYDILIYIMLDNEFFLMKTNAYVALRYYYQIY